MTSAKKYYLTTPLYYVNDVPHIGHAYTTIAADVLARWKRLRGEPVFFLTGTDEHGAKIAQAAAAAGKTPKEFTDGVVESFKKLWTRLGITNDDFIRTTEERHVKVVQAVFDRLHKQGDIYKGSYEDWYCTPCETFYSEAELIDGKCPAFSHPVEKLKEESYFFKLSKYEQPLLDYFQKNPDFLQPANRASEITNFVKDGLRDLSVSRTKVKWGVPVPFDPAHTVYVWFDALLNYITAAGFPFDKGADGPWPADIHLVGKEIFRFHTVIWPAMLMALDLPLPKRVFAHGWWTVEGEKMSKSKGNVVDPHQVADEYSVDALRYFVLREVPFGNDGDFSRQTLLNRYNADLANALGNLLNRTLQLVEKNCEGKIPAVPSGHELLGDQMLPAWLEKFDAAMDRLAFHDALQQIFNLVSVCNKYMDDKAPWKAVKTQPLDAYRTLYDVLRVLKWTTIVLNPFMPTVTREIWKQLGETEDLSAAAPKILKSCRYGFRDNQTVAKGAPLFPRKDRTEQ